MSLAPKEGTGSIRYNVTDKDSAQLLLAVTTSTGELALEIASEAKELKISEP